MGLQTPDLDQGGGEGGAPVSADWRRDIHAQGVALPSPGRDGHRCAGEGGVGALGEQLQPAVQPGDPETAQYKCPPPVPGVWSQGLPWRQPTGGDPGRQSGVRIGQHRQRARQIKGRGFDAGHGLGRRLPVGEGSADAGLKRVQRQVADNDQDSIVGPVPGAMETAEGGCVDAPDCLGRADRRADAASCIRRREGLIGVRPVLCRAQSRVVFGQDHALFAGNGLRRQQQAVTDIPQPAEGEIQRFRVGLGEVQLVGRAEHRG